MVFLVFIAFVYPPPAWKVFLLGQKTGWPRFGSVTVWGWNGSSGSGFRFRRFLEGGGFCVLQYSLAERTVPVPVSVPGGSGSRFGSDLRLVTAVNFLGSYRRRPHA